MSVSNPTEKILSTYVWLFWPNPHTGKEQHCLSTANKWPRKSSGSWPSIREHEKSILFIGIRPEPLIRSLGQYNCQQNLALRKHLTGKLIKGCDFKGSLGAFIYSTPLSRVVYLACVLVIVFVISISSTPPPCFLGQVYIFRHFYLSFTSMSWFEVTNISSTCLFIWNPEWNYR